MPDAAAAGLLQHDPHIDPHIHQATVQHELGEAAEVVLGEQTGRNRSHASHIGISPILRENLAMTHAPQGAQDLQQKLRQSNPDDKLVASLVRRAGGTPNAPLPLDSKGSRAVDLMYDRLPTESLSQQSRVTAFNRAKEAPHLGIPSHMPRIADPMVSQNLAEEIKGNVKARDFKSLHKNAPKLVRSLRTAYKYMS
jgi:hypothetical protein